MHRLFLHRLFQTSQKIIWSSVGLHCGLCHANLSCEFCLWNFSSHQIPYCNYEFYHCDTHAASRIKSSKSHTPLSKMIFFKSKQCVSKMLVCNFSITVISLSQHLSFKKPETKYFFYYSPFYQTYLEYIDFGFLAVLQHGHFFFPDKDS